MAEGFYVHGTAQIVTDGSPLGITIDGAHVTFDQYSEPIYTDAGGPSVEADRQYFGQTATVDLDLIYFDPAILFPLLTGLGGDPPTFGTMDSAGFLIVTGGAAVELRIKSSPAGTGLTGNAPCWTFPNAILVDKQEVELGVKRSSWKLTFRCIPDFNPSGSFGQVLFTNSCS